MRTSAAGIDFIKREEGLRLRAYKCAAGIWTIGYGHTRGVSSGQYISKGEAEILLLKDILNFENELNPLILTVPKQYEYDAIVSFVFNIGVAKFAKSQLLTRINDGIKGNERPSSCVGCTQPVSAMLD